MPLRGNDSPVAALENTQNLQEVADRDVSNLTPRELVDLALKLAKLEQNDELLAAAAGLLPGRIMANYFAHLDTKLKDAQQKDAKARADMHYLALLQAQLDALEADIAVLDDQIDALDQLIDSVEEDGILDPNDPEHRRLLQQSGIPEDQWDGLTLSDLRDVREQRRQERDAKAERKADVAEAMKHASPEEQKHIAQTADLEAVREARDKAAPEMRGEVESTIDSRYDKGNDSRLDDFDAQLENLGETSLGGDFFDEPIDLEKSISTAQAIAPENPVRDAAPDIQRHYEVASADSRPAEPEAQTTFDLHKANVPETGLG